MESLSQLLDFCFQRPQYAGVAVGLELEQVFMKRLVFAVIQVLVAVQEKQDFDILVQSNRSGDIPNVKRWQNTPLLGIFPKSAV